MSFFSPAESRNRVLASGLGVTLQKTDRILSGSSKLVVVTDTKTRETKTTGDNIQIGLEGLNLAIPRDVTVAMGKNYHELAHFLFSQRLTYYDVEITWGNEIVHIASSWNYLEEARVETLFSALYGKSKYYFTVTFSDMAMQSGWQSLGAIAGAGKRPTQDQKERYSALSLHLLSHGRAYLPQNVRTAIRDGAFTHWTDPADVKRIIEAESIIDTYRTLTTAELDEERSVSDPNGKNVRLKRFKLAALKLALLFPELFNSSNKNGECQENGGYGQLNSKTREQKKEDEKKEKEASQKAEQDKKDDYEEVELSDESDEDNSDDEEQEGEGEGEETDQDDQDGTANGSGEEESQNDEGDDQSEAGGAGGASDDDGEESDDGTDDDGNGSEQGSTEDDDNSGEEDGESDSESSDDESSSIGVGGGPAPLTKQEQKEMLESVISQVVDNSTISNEIDRIASDIESAGEQSNGAEMHTDWTDTENNSDREAIAEVSRVFEGLREQVAPGWNYGSDTGRLNVNRAMLNADPDDMYDEWYEGKEDDASVEMVILLDLSGSMGGQKIVSASRLVHTLRRSLSELDSHVSVYGFSMPDAHVVLKGRDDMEEGNGVPIYSTIGGTDVHSALKRAQEVFAQSDSVNRILTVITDGVWENNRSGISWADTSSTYLPDDEYMDSLRNMGAHKVLCFINREEIVNSGMRFANRAKTFIDALVPEFDSSFDCHDPMSLVEPLTEVVRAVVQRAIL